MNWSKENAPVLSGTRTCTYYSTAWLAWALTRPYSVPIYLGCYGTCTCYMYMLHVHVRTCMYCTCMFGTYVPVRTTFVEYVLSRVGLAIRRVACQCSRPCTMSCIAEIVTWYMIRLGFKDRVTTCCTIRLGFQDRVTTCYTIPFLWGTMYITNRVLHGISTPFNRVLHV